MLLRVLLALGHRLDDLTHLDEPWKSCAPHTRHHPPFSGPAQSTRFVPHGKGET
jgi:hypothetical protein